MKIHYMKQIKRCFGKEYPNKEECENCQFRKKCAYEINRQKKHTFK